MQINYFLQLRCDGRPYSVLGVSSRCHTYRSALGSCLSKGAKRSGILQGIKRLLVIFICFTTQYSCCIKSCVLFLCYQLKKGTNWALHLAVNTCDQKEYHSKVVLSRVYPVSQHHDTSKIMLMILH